MVTILQVRDDGLGMGEQPDYFTLTGTIIYAKDKNFCYPACLSEGCNKKVTDMGDGTWRCEKCQINHNRPEYRYIMSLNVIDHTGQLWLSCFDDVGQMIMGISANELMNRMEDGTHMKAFEQVVCQTYTFKCRAKMDTYQDQQRYIAISKISQVILTLVLVFDIKCLQQRRSTSRPRLTSLQSSLSSTASNKE